MPKPTNSFTYPPYDVILYNTVNEAFTNIAKYTNANIILFEFHETGGSIKLLIQDDGVGFDVDNDTLELGILGVREKVSSIVTISHCNRLSAMP